MRIVVSFRQIRVVASGGIGHHIRYPLEALIRMRPDWEFHLVETFFNHRNFCGTGTRNCHHHLLARPSALDIDFLNLLEKIDPDVVLYPAPGEQYPQSSSIGVITLMADLQHRHIPKYFNKSDLMRRQRAYNEAIQKSDYIITSPTPREDIISYYNCSPDRVVSVPPGLSPLYMNSPKQCEVDEVLDAYKIREPYFCYPANYWPHKNHDILYEALATLKKKYDNPVYLILSGNLYDREKEYLKSIRKWNVEDRVKHLRYIPDNVMPCIIAGAKALVYPSYFEGFGIPIIEALALETPVICSNISSLSGVAGEGAILVGPESAQGFSDAMARIMEEPGLGKALAKTGKAQIHKHAIEHSAQALMKVCEKSRRKPKGRVVIHENPIVSVITPSYNQAKYLRATIDSVLGQDYPNIEYLVIDGGSSDTSVEILKSYGSQFYWISEPDRGQTHAINKGLRRARGTILAYLNSDDTLAPGAIGSVVDYFKSHPETDLMYGKVNYIDSDGKFIRAYPTRDWDSEFFAGECIVAQPGAFWQRETIKRFGYFDESLQYVMDYEYWMRIATRGGKVCHMPKLLANSRDYLETKTNLKRREILKEHYIILKKHYSCIPTNWLRSNLEIMFMENPGRLAWMSKTDLTSRLYRNVLEMAVIIHGFIENRGPTENRHAVRLAWLHSRLLFLMRAYFVPQKTGYLVRGLYGDGWVEPTLKIRCEPRRYIDHFVVQGESPTAQRLRLLVDGKEEIVRDVPAGEFILEAHNPSKSFQSLDLISSEPAQIDVRQAGFRLIYTNLFTDLDLVPYQDVQNLWLLIKNGLRKKNIAN